MRSTPLSTPISIKLWGSEETITFETIADILAWSKLQHDAWVDIPTPAGNLGQMWRAQRSHADTVHQLAVEIQKNSKVTDVAKLETASAKIDQQLPQLRKWIENYANGNALSTAHPHFSHIQAIAEVDPSAGAVLLAACRLKGRDFLAQNASLDAIARLGVVSAQLDSSRKKTIATLRSELASLKERAETDISELRDIIDGQIARSAEQASVYLSLTKASTDSFDALAQKCNSEWEELKNVYDEKLALLAPTEYWRTRSVMHKDKARNYAIAFSAALAVMVAAFLSFGIKHLDDPGTGSVVLALLPVLIPAFAAVWVLRILGRLLSENLKISQDAQERETLVKTFLALMRDDTTGKSVVTDDDRTLILQALFRQSTVTAVDDAPPLHWLEALRRNKA